MQTLSFKEKVNTVFSTTSHVFAEQEAKSYEEEVNDFLDFISRMRDGLSQVIIDYDIFLDELNIEIAKTSEIKDLILLREEASPLYNLSKKLLSKFTAKREYRFALKSVLEEFKDCINDLQEMLDDINKRLNKNSKIDSLLSDINELSV